MIHIRKLTVQYGKRIALNGVDLALETGQVLGVIGPNGAGKTTLIRALTGAVPITNGEILLNAKNVNDLSPSERARSMAVVPQARGLPPAFTGWEMVLMGRTPYLNWLGQISARDEDIAKKAMEKTETWDLRDRRIGELSGGEQQSLLLARALTQKAPLLLLDEPTTHLDLHHQISLLDQVRRLAKQERLTVIAVLHDLNLVSRFADHILLLLNGKVRAFGNASTIMKPAILREAFQVPLKILKDPRWRFPIVIPPDTTQ